MSHSHLKLNKTVTLKHPTSIEVACSFTGITSTLLVASLPDTIKLDYQHPLSYLSNSRKVAALPLAALSKVEPQVLAGAALTIYQHFGLVEVPAAQDAFVSNSVLRTVGLPSLLAALQLSCVLTKQNTKLLPHFSLDYQTHKEATSVGDAFSSYLRLLKTNLSSTEEAGSTTALVIRAEGGKGEIKPSTRSDWDKDFDKRLVEAKQEAKELLAELKGFFWANGYEKLEIFLKSTLPNRNLVALEKPIREKVITRLQEAAKKASEPLQATKILKLVDIVRDSENPYDIFAKANDLLERASDSFAEQPKRKSLAEILAEKTARSAPPVIGTASVFIEPAEYLEAEMLAKEESEQEEDLLEEDEDEVVELEDTFDRFLRFEAAMTAQGE